MTILSNYNTVDIDYLIVTSVGYWSGVRTSPNLHDAGNGEQAMHSEVFNSILNNTDYDKRERPKAQQQIQVKHIVTISPGPKLSPYPIYTAHYFEMCDLTQA